LLTALTRPFTGALLTTRFFFGLAFAIFQTIFSLYALKKFNLTAAQTGYCLTYLAFFRLSHKAFWLGALRKMVREDILIVSCVA